MLHLTRLVKNEARLSPYEAHCSNTAMYEAPLGSGMRRSLGRLHFLPKAKMVPGAGIEPARPFGQRILSPLHQAQKACFCGPFVAQT